MPEDAFFPDVYVQLINGGGARLRLANDGHVRDYPSWSPDSRWIATGPVKQVDAPGAAVHLGGLEHAGTLALSRDGTKLIFSRGADNSDIWRLDVHDPAKSGWLAPSTLWDGGAFVLVPQFVSSSQWISSKMLDTDVHAGPGRALGAIVR